MAEATTTTTKVEPEKTTTTTTTTTTEEKEEEKKEPVNTTTTTTTTGSRRTSTSATRTSTTTTATTATTPYYFNPNPVPLKETPVEHSQPTTTEDQEIAASLHKEFGERLDVVAPDVVTRFVRGYAHEKERKKATIERMQHYLEFFDKYQFKTIIAEPWPGEKDCWDAWPVYIYGTDRQGHPVLYDEIGSVALDRVERAFSGEVEKLRKYRQRLMRRLAIRKEELSKQHGVMIYKHVMVMDVSAASITSLNKFNNLVQTVISEEQHMFPETLHKLYIVNASWTFRMIWKIVSNFVDPLTYQKIHVLGSGYLDEMLKIMDKEEIPPKYGGTCKKPFEYELTTEEVPTKGKDTKNGSQPTTETATATTTATTTTTTATS